MDTISGFSGKSYEKIVQKKDPGNHENGVHGARFRPGIFQIDYSSSDYSGNSPVSASSIRPSSQYSQFCLSSKISYFSKLKPFKSGFIPAPVSREFQKEARIEPRFGSANPLFDRKLLDIVHEEGVRKKP